MERTLKMDNTTIFIAAFQENTSLRETAPSLQNRSELCPIVSTILYPRAEMLITKQFNRTTVGLTSLADM